MVDEGRGGDGRGVDGNGQADIEKMGLKWTNKDVWLVSGDGEVMGLATQTIQMRGRWTNRA